MSKHYYSENQDSEVRLTKIRVEFFNRIIKLNTASGVFSVGKVDRGTEVLLNYCRLEDGWDVLDLGCGNGVVGIAVAKGFPNSNVIMTDVNKRAVKTARANVRMNNLQNAKVKQGMGFEKISGKFDTILFNPPQTAGKDICLRLINESNDYLKPDGLLQLVARHNKGGKALSAYMQEIFGNLETLARKSGYRVYVSQN